jgi:cyclopropane fatty-acyl-phospholipid synthase-like methyltransferase
MNANSPADSTRQPIPDRVVEWLRQPAFPRSSAYDPRWVMENAMGPNVLWLAEWVCRRMELRPGMRVLDLGCGRAVSSIFLAREFDVRVWAADLWVGPTDNWERIRAAGEADRVVPLRVDAHALPFAAEYFDAVVSFDAYHYFGTDDLYLGQCARVVRRGGRLGIAVPGVREELAGDAPEHLAPEHLRPYWEWEFCSFHTPLWWRRHWQKTGLVRVEVADELEDGWRLWREWNEARIESGELGDPAQREGVARETEMLRLDAGRTFGFTRAVAQKT